MIAWTGPSEYDGAPLAVVINGIATPSKNRKTGPMAQTWIIRSDVHPHEAVTTGADASVCADCVFRPAMDSGMRCYLNMVRSGPGQAYKMLPFYKPMDWSKLEHKKTRIGAYGNPSAVPLSFFDNFDFHRVTSYEHNWRNCDPAYSEFSMASVSSPEEREEAKARGWRTFRVRMPGDPVLPGEAQCPGSKEMGYRLTCAECMVCNGNAKGYRGDITTILH